MQEIQPLVLDTHRALGDLEDLAQLEPSRDSVSWHQLSDVVNGNPVRHPTSFRCLWIANRLVLDVIALVTNSTRLRSRFRQHNEPLYEEDVVEWFIEPSVSRLATSRYLELEVSPKGILFDAWVRNRTSNPSPEPGSSRGTTPERSLELDFNPESATGPTATVLLDGRPPSDFDDAELLTGVAASEWRSRISLPLDYLGLTTEHPSAKSSSPNSPTSRSPTSRTPALRMNVYRIQGTAEGREYQAWSPTGAVDFHRPRSFRTVELRLASQDRTK